MFAEPKFLEEALDAFSDLALRHGGLTLEQPMWSPRRGKAQPVGDMTLMDLYAVLELGGTRRGTLVLGPEAGWPFVPQVLMGLYNGLETQIIMDGDACEGCRQKRLTAGKRPAIKSLKSQTVTVRGQKKLVKQFRLDS